MGRSEMILPAALVLVAASCNGDKLTNVVLEEYLVDVTCNSQGTCTDAGGENVEGTWVEASAIASATASMFRPHGTYMYIDYMRDETYVEIEMDFPTDLTGEVPVAATMREYAGGEMTYQSDTVSGVVQIAPPGEANSIPVTGGFHLKFTNDGPDAERGSDDDVVREIRNGRFELEYVPSTGEIYDPPCSEHAWDDPDFGVIVEIWIYSEDEYHDEYYDGYQSSGCNDSSTYDDEYSSDYDSGGCEGDTYYEDDPYYDESGGCDSGSQDWSTSDESGGCEGDTYEGDDTGGCDCEGDSALTARRPSRRAFALFVPAFAIFATRSLLRRRK